MMETQMVGIDEWYVKSTHTLYMTTLGSCVAIILWDPMHHVSAMNHFLLPHRHHRFEENGKNNEQMGNHDLISAMIEKIIHKGGKVHQLRGLIVGGAESSFDHYQIGAQNVQSAINALEKYQIRKYQLSVGGNFSRKVRFDSSAGTVTIHKIAIGEKGKSEQEIIHLGGAPHDT